MLIKADSSQIYDKCVDILDKLSKIETRSYTYTLDEEKTTIQKLLYLCQSEYIIDKTIFLSYEDLQDLESIENLANVVIKW